MNIGEIKPEYAHQATLRVSLVKCDDEPASICLCQSVGALSFQFAIDPDEIENFVALLRTAARLRLEGVQA